MTVKTLFCAHCPRVVGFSFAGREGWPTCHGELMQRGKECPQCFGRQRVYDEGEPGYVQCPLCKGFGAVRNTL